MSSFENQIRAVVFDMDGVLIDSHPAHRASWREFLRSVDRNVSEDQLSFILDGHTRQEILRHFLGDLSPSELSDYEWQSLGIAPLGAVARRSARRRGVHVARRD